MKRLLAVVFNNPFDSFHNTVAEAKEEREQLDRLLTISTPRERLLVTVIALLLFILAAWLFFGSVSRSLAVDGVLVEPDETLLERNRTVQTLVWVKGDVAPHIKAGMPAVIELGMTDGKAGTLDGKVATISAVPVSEGLAIFESTAPVSVHRVDITLNESLDYAFLASRECRVVIELGRQPPVALIRMKRSQDVATRL
ncbi:MAG: hypothetical protein OXC41_01250 [Gammaproteobacteria bacterium]|nr:hypothetical protein [Gammaproteobacteria bacterium]